MDPVFIIGNKWIYQFWYRINRFCIYDTVLTDSTFMKPYCGFCIYKTVQMDLLPMIT